MYALAAPPSARRACDTRSPASLALVVGAHLALAWILFKLPPAPLAITAPRPLMVSLVTPEPAPAPVPAKPQPSQPKPSVKPQPPKLAAPREASSNPPEPQPTVAPAPIPVAAPAPAIAPVASPPAATPVSPPRFDANYLDNPAPPYPGMSRRLGEDGRVLLRVFVQSDGSAGQVELRQSSGYPRLDAAALETVRRWRFVPARQGEEKIAAWVLVPIAFSLRNQP